LANLPHLFCAFGQDPDVPVCRFDQRDQLTTRQTPPRRATVDSSAARSRQGDSVTRNAKDFSRLFFGRDDAENDLADGLLGGRTESRSLIRTVGGAAGGIGEGQPVS
jgi:hypothetical protein